MTPALLTRIGRGARAHPVLAGVMVIAMLVWLWRWFQLAAAMPARAQFGLTVRGNLEAAFLWLALLVILPGVLLVLLVMLAGLAPLTPHRCGSCRRCGYDLRGSTGRCPECGRPFHPSEGLAVPDGEDRRK